MKFVQLLSRIIAGVVFVFSGFVKAIDPLGSAYKFIDYFNAFQLDFMTSIAFPLAVILSAIELTLGIALIFGYRMRFTGWVVFIFMSFFTVLTFILALTNPVSDCGCFGDALILTNWQTFFKNLIIMVFVIILFLYRKDYELRRSRQVEWSVLLIFFLGAALLSIYCYRHLPILDFRPYSVGTHIPSSMEIPEGAPQDEYITYLYYRNKETGEEREFTMDNFPEDTARWEFVDAQSELVSEGYEPPIHDFIISAPNGEDITNQIIEQEDYSLILIAYDLKGADSAALKHAENYYHMSLTLPDLDFYAITASTKDVINEKIAAYDLGYEFSLADEITLKTIIRSNPGLMMVKNGVIAGKWHYNDFPGPEAWTEYQSVFVNFPFCEGCDLELSNQIPMGASPGEINTTLYYRNRFTDSLKAFTMDDFPANTDEWIFEDSRSVTLRSGYRTPLDRLEITTADGENITNRILEEQGYRMIFIIKDTESLSGELLMQMNKLAGLAPENLNTEVEVYALLALNQEDLYEFSLQHISPVQFCRYNPSPINEVEFDEIMLSVLRGTHVLKTWKDKALPEPGQLSLLTGKTIVLAEADEVFLPHLFDGLKQKSEKWLVYVFILGFFTFAFLLRTLFKK